MKKIKIKRNYEDFSFTFLMILLFIAMWGGVGSYLLYLSIIHMSTNTVLDIIVSILNSCFLIGTVLVIIPLYIILYYVKQLIYPTRYKALLKSIEMENDKYKVTFEINLKKDKKSNDYISNIFTCIIDNLNELKENEYYLIKLDGNNRILNIIEYKDNYKSIKKVYKRQGIGIAILISTIFLINILTILIFYIYNSLKNTKNYEAVVYVLIVIIGIIYVMYTIFVFYKKNKNRIRVKKL